MSWIFLFKQKTAYELRISDWSSDVCSSDLSYAEWRCGAVRCPVRPLNPSTRGAPDGLRNRRPRHETAVIIRTWRDSRFRQYRYIDCCRLGFKQCSLHHTHLALTVIASICD